MYAGMKENKEQKKSSSPLIDKVNQLQAKYQAEIQGLSEEEKEAVKATRLFSDLYEALVNYIEHVVEDTLYHKIGADPKELDKNQIIAQACDAMFGLNGKEPLIETFQAKNDATFTTACYKYVFSITLRAYNKEKERLLNQLCLHKSELDEMREWSLRKIAGRYVDIEENKDRIIDRIRNNPQQVYEEQLYLKSRIREIKKYMDIVAEGPEIKKRSTSNKPVYRWVGGSVGAYLSPVMDCEWQKMNWVTDGAYKTASLIQELALWVAGNQAAETLRMPVQGKVREWSKTSETERSVSEKIVDQMELALKQVRKTEEERIKKEGTSKNEFRKLSQVYYKELSSIYKAKVSADAEFALAWTWQVIHGLTAEEAAWLFAREMAACVPVLKFDWKTAFKNILKEQVYALLFETVTTEKTTQRWPKEIRDKVVEIKEEREKEKYANLLSDIETAKEEYEDFLYDRIDKLLEEIKDEKNSIDDFRKRRKGAAELGRL